MGLMMQSQGWPAGEGLATLVTSKGPGTRMYHLVLSEVSPGAVGLVTLWAGKGPDPAVAQRVGFEALL